MDDEKPARDELAFLLKNFPDVNVIGQGKNGLEAIALIKERNPDLAFLDEVQQFSNGCGSGHRVNLGSDGHSAA